MFQLSTKELAELGAEITTREIKQQPELWQETLTIYQEKQEAITTFLRTIKEKTDKRIRVVFTERDVAICWRYDRSLLE